MNQRRVLTLLFTFFYETIGVVSSFLSILQKIRFNNEFNYFLINCWFEGFFYTSVSNKLNLLSTKSSTEITVPYTQMCFIAFGLISYIQSSSYEMKYCHLHILTTQFWEQTLILSDYVYCIVGWVHFCAIFQVENYSKASFKVIFICLRIFKHSHNLIRKRGREWSLKCNESNWINFSCPKNLLPFLR